MSNDDFILEGNPRLFLEGGSMLYWAGLGGSRAIAIAGSVAASENRTTGSTFVELDWLAARVASSPIEAVFVSASGGNPSMVRAAEDLARAGHHLGLVTLCRESPMVSLIRRYQGCFYVSPGGDAYVDEFVAYVNTRQLLRSLKHFFERAGGIAESPTSNRHVPDLEIAPDSFRSGAAVLVYDDVGRAAATDLSLRITEGGYACSLVHFSDFVHGSYATVVDSIDDVRKQVFVFAQDCLIDQLQELKRTAEDQVSLHLIGIGGRCVADQIWSISVSQHIARRAMKERRHGHLATHSLLGRFLWKNFR